VYVIFAQSELYVVLDNAPTLELIATLLASRSEGGLSVYVSQDGRGRGLNAGEHRERDELLQAARDACAPSAESYVPGGRERGE